MFYVNVPSNIVAELYIILRDFVNCEDLQVIHISIVENAPDFWESPVHGSYYVKLFLTCSSRQDQSYSVSRWGP